MLLIIPFPVLPDLRPRACAPGLPGTVAGVLGETSAPTWLQDEAGRQLLDSVAEPGEWPGTERQQP